MSVFYVENNQKSRLKLNLFRVALFLTFVYKMWFIAEMQYNAYGAMVGGEVFGRILVYTISGLVGFLMAILAVVLTYSMFARSQYCPANEMCDCRINKQTYYTMAYLSIGVSNLICGTLNFIAYAYSISIVFITVIVPVIMSIFSICCLVFVMSFECKKGEIKQLITSMALPSIIFMLLLR